MKDSTRRGIRTALQLVVTLLTTGGIQGLLALFGLTMSPEQYAVVTGALLPVVTAVLNGLEDSGKIPAVLKAPANDGASPLPDAGYVTAGYLLGLTLVLAGIFVAIFGSLVLGVISIVCGAAVLYLRE
jgi:hypothetical protein